MKKLTTYEHARTNTFKVSIKASDYDKALRPEVWPLRVGVRLFRPKRSTQTWAQQSASIGGSIQANGGRNLENSTLENNVTGRHDMIPVTPVITSNRFALLGEMGTPSVHGSQN